VVVALDKQAVMVVRGIRPVVLSIWAMRKRRIFVALLLPTVYTGIPSTDRTRDYRIHVHKYSYSNYYFN
jgi:hypothetical protein